MTEFSQQQGRHLRKLLVRTPCYAEEKSAESFILNYVFFEAVVRLIGRYYRESQRPPRKATDGKEPLNIISVGKWFLFFKIQVHPERLALILDSNRIKRKFKSARKLRNGLVHVWDHGDYKEVVVRFDELYGALSGVVSSVSKRVKV